MILRLQGRKAFSDFRLKKLQEAVVEQMPRMELRTEFWHFVQTERALTHEESERLKRLLSYGPSEEASTAEGHMLLVASRPGTLSPWSSKATDIARLCGLSMVQRIERVTAFWVNGVSQSLMQSVLVPLIHDRMTQVVLDSMSAVERGFDRFAPQPLQSIVLLKDQGVQCLEKANRELGLALSAEEIDYLFHYYSRINRDPTDVELMMFAQANSEHCRHKIFNADWFIDGQAQSETLFGMIRTTHAKNPAGTVVAYSDNASVIEGALIERLTVDPQGRYGFQEELSHILMKVETHNHPTAIAPHPGAATGSGGEIRDEGATGRGSKPKAGLTGFSVSHLCIPGAVMPWEVDAYAKPSRIASALQIMLEGPIGGAAFNNEFGRPNLTGYFRSFELSIKNQHWGYHKPIMIAGGVGSIAARDAFKLEPEVGDLLIQLGGPGLLIGLGGGAASSMATGSNQEDLDFNSVQRGNPEMQRRAQEVIDRCCALGQDNPILSIHDVGAGGLSNALPEMVHSAGRGGHFQLRAIPSEEPGMSPMQIWSNEAQERYVMAIQAKSLARFKAICDRERCPFAVVGVTTEALQVRLEDTLFKNFAVDMDLSVLLGKPPKMVRHVQRLDVSLPRFDSESVNLREAIYRVLQMPCVADKSFLINIGDRSVGGLTARDQMVGPWQVPVADVAVTAMGFKTFRGEAFAMGERTPLALINPAASGRMAVGEAITNLLAAPVGQMGDIKLSANWMAAAGHPGEEAALFDTVKAVAMDLCPKLGISIPVGKDSLSMKTAWQESSQLKQVTSPLSLVVSAFAPVSDVRHTLTPQLRLDCGETDLIVIDSGSARMGGSTLAQVYAQLGDEAPDLDHPEWLIALSKALRSLNEEQKILAYHDRSDGGLLACLCEMMFAGHCGVMFDVTALSRKGVNASLFNEELGVVLQVRRMDTPYVMRHLSAAGLGSQYSHVVGEVNAGDLFIISANGSEVFRDSRINLHRAWSSTSFHMQQLRDNPHCAREAYDALLSVNDPGLNVKLSFEWNGVRPEVSIQTAVRPRIAILREQGVNGQIEMAAAFDRAGFECVDVHMSDVLSARVSLKDFKGFAACGGFSYGDVLGAGEGWAKSILFNDRARDEFEAFFNRSDTFALGVCNGCQMMSNLYQLIPGARDWPHFVTNRSEQFEARVCLVEVQKTPSLFFEGMHGSRLPVVVSHGEGFAEFSSDAALKQTKPLVSLRFVDNQGHVTQRYPQNPNGSPQGITGLSTPDGRFNILMPHPERVFRTVQNSWHPLDWPDDSPWLKMFLNARAWVN
jgi:phosphoribosylformylglycinamidine synthase